ncbi:MAG: GAF domain-containing protein, partial [Acidimicrobiia bacterium]
MTALTQDRRAHERQADDRTIEIDAVRADIEREERLVGLRPDGFVTPVEIKHRRLQIVAVMLLVFVGLAVTTIANDIWNDLKRQGTWLDPEMVRIGMIVFAAGFAVYVLEKEHHLKRLSFLGRRAKELDLVLAERMLMSAILAEATETVTTSIDLEQVLAQILHEGDRLVGASLASIVLVNDGGHLEEAWTRGASVTDGRRLVAESVLLQVAVSQEPLLLVGPLPSELTGQTTGPARVASVALIPLVRDKMVLGVLTVAALPGRRYSTGDLDVLTRLATPASQAIANARRYEAARLQDFDGIDTRREELREIG